MHSSAKKEDYLTKERLNYYVNNGKITKYDSRTGKGIYKTNGKESNEFEFSISLDDWTVTVED